jgi:hypothetical protein
VDRVWPIARQDHAEHELLISNAVESKRSEPYSRGENASLYKREVPDSQVAAGAENVEADAYVESCGGEESAAFIVERDDRESVMSCKGLTPLICLKYVVFMRVQ